MVQSISKLEEHANKVLNIIKAKFGLKDKSEAVNLVVEEYEHYFLEPELRTDYKKKLSKIMKGRHVSREQMEKEVI